MDEQGTFTFDGKPVHYKLECIIGSGAFGKVYTAVTYPWGKRVAMKRVEQKRKDEEGWSKTVSDCMNLCKRLRSLPHENLIGYYAVENRTSQSQLEFGSMIIVMEYCPGKRTLEKDIELMGIFFDRFIAPYARQIFSGLSYLHENGIVHTDIKPANILIQNTLGFGEGVLKICDLDDAVILEGEKNEINDFRGTLSYYSPEMAFRNASIESGKKISEKTDVWSAGSVILDMLQGYNKRVIKIGEQRIKVRDSFIEDLTRALVNGGMPELQGRPYQEPIFRFLEKCFERDPDSRLNAEDWPSYPFLWSTRHCPVIGYPNEKLVEIGYSGILSIFMGEYYRDMRAIFQERQGENIAWKVIIVGKTNLARLFENVNHLISAIEFHYAHEWSSDLLNGLNLLNLVEISFCDCKDIQFRTGHWQLLSKLRKISLVRSNISQIQNNFLKEIPSLEHFHDSSHSEDKTLSALKNYALLHSTESSWYRDYRINTPTLGGGGEAWQKCASGESLKCAIFLLEEEKLDKVSRNLKEIKNEFPMNPFSSRDIWDGLKAFHPTLNRYLNEVNICFTESLVSLTIKRLSPIQVRLAFPSNMEKLNHLKAIFQELSRLFNGHPLALKVSLKESENAPWDSIWEVISPLQRQIILLEILEHIFLQGTSRWRNICSGSLTLPDNFYLPNLLEIRVWSNNARISSKHFTGFPKLRALLIRTNDFSLVDQDIFDGLKTLQYFEMTTLECRFSLQEMMKTLNKPEFNWFWRKFVSDAALFEMKQPGEVWEITNNGYSYCNSFPGRIYEADKDGIHFDLEYLLQLPGKLENFGQDTSEIQAVYTDLKALVSDLNSLVLHSLPGHTAPTLQPDYVRIIGKMLRRVRGFRKLAQGRLHQNHQDENKANETILSDRRALDAVIIPTLDVFLGEGNSPGLEKAIFDENDELVDDNRVNRKRNGVDLEDSTLPENEVQKM